MEVSPISRHVWAACGSSTITVDRYASIWPQTTRFNTRREYSSLATASSLQCNTCYGRDGTTASRSINTERGSAALALTRKQKAIARLSVSFQQGGPGFKFDILQTFAVTVAVTLFVQPLALKGVVYGLSTLWNIIKLDEMWYKFLFTFSTAALIFFWLRSTLL